MPNKYKLKKAIYREIGPDEHGDYHSVDHVEKIRSAVKKRLRKKLVPKWADHEENIIRGAVSSKRTADDNLSFKYNLGDLLK